MARMRRHPRPEWPRRRKLHARRGIGPGPEVLHGKRNRSRHRPGQFVKSLARQLSWELHLIQRTVLTVRALVSMGVAAHIERTGGFASGALTEELVTLLLCCLRRR